jgi:hypothetical protein
MLLGQMGVLPASVTDHVPDTGVLIVIPKDALSIKAVGTIKDKLWRVYPRAVLQPFEDWWLVLHQGDIMEMRLLLGPKWYTIVIDSAICYVCK